MTLPSSRLAAAILALGVAGVILFPGLGAYPLWDPDEGRHAEIAREVLAASDWGGWVTPRLNDEPYREKPILFYWATAAAYAIAGVNELGARLVPALAAFATVVFVFAWSLRRWGPRPAALSALVLVTAVEFAALGRFTNLDMLLTMFLTAGILAVERWSATGRPAWLLAAAMAAGLGTLTKGLVAPALIGVVGLVHLVATRRLPLLRPRPLALALLVVAAITVPWHLAAARLDPDYLRELYVEGHFGRYVGTERTLHHEPFWFYVPVLLGGFFPWSALLPATIAGALARGRRDADTWLCLWWAGLIFVFFSASASKVGTYVLPCFPPLALLTGRALARLLERDTPWTREHRLARAGLWVVAGVLVAAPVVLVVLGRHAWDGTLATTSLMALVLLPAGVAVAVLLRRDRLPQALALLGAGAVLVICGFYRFAAPSVSRIASAAPLAEAIVASVPVHDAVPVVAFAVRAPSLMFYLRRPIMHLARWRPLRKVVAGAPLVLVVTSPRHTATIARAGITEPWRTGGRRELWASQPLPHTLTPPTDGGDKARR